MPKNIQTTVQLHLFHMLARWYSKFYKLDFNSMWTENFQMFKLDLEKTKEAAIKLPTYLDHRKSKRIPEKHLSLLHWLHYSLCVDHNKLENSERDGNTKPLYMSSVKPVCSKEQQLEPDMEQWTGSKLRKEYIKAVYCHLLI